MSIGERCYTAKAAGESFASIARREGIHKNTVRYHAHKHAIRNNLPPLNRFDNTSVRVSGPMTELQESIIDLAANTELSVEDIALELEANRHYVSRVIKARLPNRGRVKPKQQWRMIMNEGGKR